MAKKNNEKQFPGSPTMRAIAACVRADVVPHIVGHPGEAKTALLTNLGENSGFFTQVILGSVRTSADFLGIPFERKLDLPGGGSCMTTGYLTPDWKARTEGHGKALLVFDEFTTSAPDVVKAMARILNERFVGDEKLHNGVRIIAISNPSESSVGGYDLPPPIVNRMCHINWNFDVGNWLNGYGTSWQGSGHDDTFESLTPDEDPIWARSAIAGFLHTNTSLVNPGPDLSAASIGKQFTTPRGWDLVGKVLSFVHREDTVVQRIVVNGLLGEGTGHTVMEWLRSFDAMDPRDAMKNPSSVKWDTSRLDLLYSLMVGVSTLGQSGKRQDFEQACDVIFAGGKAGRRDIVVSFIDGLIDAKNKHDVRDEWLLPKGFTEQFSEVMGNTTVTV